MIPRLNKEGYTTTLQQDVAELLNQYIVTRPEMARELGGLVQSLNADYADNASNIPQLITRVETSVRKLLSSLNPDSLDVGIRSETDDANKVTIFISGRVIKNSEVADLLQAHTLNSM